MAYANELSARNAYLVELLKYVGIQEGSAYHQAILDAYNKITPLPRGYKAASNDSWCAVFLCAIAWELGYRSWPWECSCTLIRDEAKRQGIWNEGWSEIPKLGDWIIYDWGNNGTMDHIGSICAIIDNAVWVVEGNYGDAVKIRRITVGDDRVEGSVALDFSEMVEILKVSTDTLRPGDSGDKVRCLQVMLRGTGYYSGPFDGDYGANTTAAVTAFQAANNLEPDGKCGPLTQDKLRSGVFVVTTTDKEVENVEKNAYKHIDDVPEYARPTIAKLVDRGLLLGVDTDDLGLTDDMIRMLVINDRAGLYDMS